MSTSNTSLIDKASTLRTKVSVDIILTTVSSIIIAGRIVSLVIAEAIGNNRWRKPNNAVFFVMAYTIGAVIHVDVDTAVSAIKVAISIVTLIMAITISKQFQVGTI